MLSDSFTKENLDLCLKELAKEFKKLNGKTMPAEIILIGGAAILAEYGFRDRTYDIDAIIQASSAMKEAINHTGDKLNLPTGWLNTDFMKTKSYSPKLVQYSKYYKKFSGIVSIRIVSAEYLIAMKLMAGRQYKNDLSDIVGILLEHEKNGNPISYEQVDKAVINLYGTWDDISDFAKQTIKDIFDSNDYETLYDEYRKSESETKSDMIEFEEKYPKVMNNDNADDIISRLKLKRENN